MREWTEKHILELIEKTAARENITRPSGGTPDYGFGLVNDSTISVIDRQLFNLLMNPNLNVGSSMNGRLNYAYACISEPVLLTDYYGSAAGKTIDGTQAQRPLVEVELGIRLSNKAVGPYNNELVGYIIDQPIKVSNGIRQRKEIEEPYQLIINIKDIPTLMHLDYSPENLLNFTGENGEIVTCRQTTITGEYKVYNTEEDYNNQHLSSKYMQVPAYEIRVTCGEIASRLSPSPGKIKGVVQL